MADYNACWFYRFVLVCGTNLVQATSKNETPLPVTTQQRIIDWEIQKGGKYRWYEFKYKWCYTLNLALAQWRKQKRQPLAAYQYIIH